jgi:hypothetical protein
MMITDPSREIYKKYLEPLNKPGRLQHVNDWVQDDPKLPRDSGEVPISEWSGWQFNFRCEIFSLLDGRIQLGR